MTEIRQRFRNGADNNVTDTKIKMLIRALALLTALAICLMIPVYAADEIADVTYGFKAGVTDETAGDEGDTAPTRAAPTKAAPTRAAPTRATPTKAAPTRVIPTKAVPTRVIPAGTAPAKAAPARRIRPPPVKSTPAYAAGV